MKTTLLHIVYILTALLMLGGVFFWAGVAAIGYDYYVLGIDYWHVEGKQSASVETPTNIAPTYVAIPTVPGQSDPASTAEPQITATIVATATPQPATDTPVAEPTADQPTSTSAPQPTAIPTEAATASPEAPTEPAIAAVPVCPTLKNEVLLIEGTSTLPAASGLLLMYDNKVVGGGSIKAGGSFSIPLAKAPRIAGEHTIDVVLRGTETHVKPVFVKRTTCTLSL